MKLRSQSKSKSKYDSHDDEYSISEYEEESRSASVINISSSSSDSDISIQSTNTSESNSKKKEKKKGKNKSSHGKKQRKARKKHSPKKGSSSKRVIESTKSKTKSKLKNKQDSMSPQLLELDDDTEHILFITQTNKNEKRLELDATMYKYRNDSLGLNNYLSDTLLQLGSSIKSTSIIYYSFFCSTYNACSNGTNRLAQGYKPIINYNLSKMKWNNPHLCFVLQLHNGKVKEDEKRVKEHNKRQQQRFKTTGSRKLNKF